MHLQNKGNLVVRGNVVNIFCTVAYSHIRKTRRHFTYWTLKIFTIHIYNIIQYIFIIHIYNNTHIIYMFFCCLCCPNQSLPLVFLFFVFPSVLAWDALDSSTFHIFFVRPSTVSVPFKKIYLVPHSYFSLLLNLTLYVIMASDKNI